MDGGLTSRGLGVSVNWREIGMDLRRCGWGASKISVALNVDRTTARGWTERGHEPRYSDGLLLLKLHARIVSGVDKEARFAVRI